MRSKLLAPVLGLAFVAVLGLAVTLLLTRTTETRVYAAFSVVAPVEVSDSGLVARAIVGAGQRCPEISAVGDHGDLVVAMTERRPGPIGAQAFSHYVACSATLPSGLTAASIDGHSIPAAMPTKVTRIAAVADTGCRLKTGDPIQDCNSAEGWPFATVIESIVESRPDIVLDPGDYFYREIPCPTDFLDRCAGSAAPVAGLPFPANDLGWMQDAFEPMSPLFPVAPIAFLRGNHEDCNRGGYGYFLYLDPFPGTEQTCEPVRTATGLENAPAHNFDPWTFDLTIEDGRTLRIAMVDSSNGGDYEPNKWVDQQRAAFTSLVARNAATPGVETWVLTHRPVFALYSSTLLPRDLPSISQWVSVQESLGARDLLTPYDLVITSHVHLAQITQIPGQPVELLLGNGGTQLEPRTGYEDPGFGPLTSQNGKPQVAGVEPYPRASYLWTWVDFGWSLLTPGPRSHTWSVDLMDRDGAPIHSCELVTRSISCD